MKNTLCNLLMAIVCMIPLNVYMWFTSEQVFSFLIGQLCICVIILAYGAIKEFESWWTLKNLTEVTMKVKPEIETKTKKTKKEEK